MKITAAVLSLFLLHALPSESRAASAPQTPFGNAVQGYQLSWSDEFDGTALDLGKWVYRTDTKFRSTQLPANVSVSDGRLKLALRKQKTGGMDYTGAGIISKEAFQYGYYEARFRVPPGAGWHTSFWAQQSDGSGSTKPMATQEIDFCEQNSVNLQKYSAGVIAWGDKGKEYGRQYLKAPNLHTDFHVWGCEFTPETVKFYFDGQLTHQTSAKPFKKGPQNIWLTSIACNFDGIHAMDDQQLPALAEYDYVRFFTKPEAKVDSTKP